MPTVKLGKLREIASREFRRSPRKCVLLSLMIPIALYYWVPLARKWTHNGPRLAAAPPIPLARPPVEPKAGHALGNSSASKAAGAADDGVTTWNTNAPNWSEVVEQMNNDPRKKSIAWSDEDRNPFQTSDMKPVLELRPQEVTEPESVSFDVEQLKRDLRLEGTIVGGRRPVATINGRAFAEGETVDVRKLGVRFENSRSVSLVRVTGDRAVLRFGAQIVSLELPKLEKRYQINTDRDTDKFRHD